MRFLLLIPVLAAASCASDSTRLGLREGRADALRDIESGTPVLRAYQPLSIYELVDDATGLPTRNWTERCGLGLDVDRHDAQLEGYNAVVLEALAQGRLDTGRLVQKTITRDAAEAALRKGTPVEFSIAPRLIEVTGPIYRVTFDVNASGTPEGTTAMHRVTESASSIDCFVEGSCVVAFAHAGTTLLLRASDGRIETWDLASGRHVQTFAAE